MSAFIIKLLKRQQPVIYGTGDKRRDFVYVDDVNDFHTICLQDRRTENQVFNLGSGQNYSVKDIYRLVSELLDMDIPPAYKPDLPGEANETLADIRLAASLGWKAKTDIRTGLNNAIEYIKCQIAKDLI